MTNINVGCWGFRTVVPRYVYTVFMIYEWSIVKTQNEDVKIIFHSRYLYMYNIIQLWIFYSVNMVWYLLNLTVLTEAEPRSILSNSVNIIPYLLSKMSILVLLYSETIYERYMCSYLWSRVQNNNAFHMLYFGASCIHCNSIVWRRVILARFPYLLEKRARRISRYSYLLETLISSEYDQTISGHMTVFRQWLLEKNTNYIINNNTPLNTGYTNKTVGPY